MSQAGEINIVGNNPSVPTTFVTNSGTATPAANTLNILGLGSITTSAPGNASTIDIALQGLTNHNVLVGQGTTTIGLIAPSTAGFVLTSNGPGADPTFQPITAEGAVLSFTGNDLVKEVPDGTGNFNIRGAGSITTIGSLNTETIQLNGLTNFNVLLGQGTATIGLASPGTAGIPLISNGAAAYPSFGTALVVGGGTGSTSFNINGVVISGTTTTSALTSLTLTDGQVVIGSSIGAPAAATLTAGAGITITNGHNSISIGLTGGGSAVETLTGNSGGAISPTANNINTVGTGSITIAGAGSTLTTQLTGLTNHAVLVGAGTATITNIAATANTGAVLQNNSGADPSYSTATYPSTTTVSQILYSSATNVVSGLATANRAVLTTGATGVPVLTALAADGQLIIGSTAGAPAAATLTGGTGITINNGSNSITISASTGGFTWNDQTADLNPVVKQNGYFADKAASRLVLTLPTNAAQGDTYKISGFGAQGWQLNAGAGQIIKLGSSTTAVAGNLQSTNAGDQIEVVCSPTTTTFIVLNSIGNITIN